MHATVSGASSAYARKRCHRSWIWVAGNVRTPRWRSGPNGWSRNSNAVAIPKFQPAPRRPQKSSGSSVSVARTSRPSAVTSSTAVRLSIVSPKFRWRRPTPPPSVSPATPVWPTTPVGTDEAVRLRGDVELAEERAAVRARGPRLRIRLDAAHPGHVDEEPAVRAAEAGRGVTTGSDRDLQVVVAGEANRRRDLARRSTGGR